MECTISLPDTIVEQLERYTQTEQKRSIEEAVTELLQYALRLSPKRTFSETLQIVRKVKQRLSEQLGDALERVILFGSVARRTATTDSDIDVMVIINDDLMEVDWHTRSDVRELIYDVELEDEVVFDLSVMGKSELQGIKGHTPFVENVLREGIEI
jgi:predicted nucleotidyltransferase